MKSIKILNNLFILFMMMAASFTSASSVQAGKSQIPLTAGGDLVWVKGFGGAANDIGLGTITDASGNSYVVGEFQNTVDFDPGAGTANLTSAGSTDGFISKFDSNGALVWVKQFGSTLADRAIEVKLDSNNNLYITGYFRGTVDFDPGAGTTNITSNGENDIFLLKLNNSGVFFWAKSFGSTQYDEGVDLVLDISNNIHLLSDFTGTVDFDPGASTNNLTSNSANFFDIAVTKLDSNGDFIWAKGFGSISEEYAGGIVVSEFGNVFITGNFDGTVDFNPNAGVFNLTSSFYDMFINALDSNGQFLWAARVGGSGIEEGNDIAIDTADNIYVVGNFQDTVDFNPKSDNFYLSSNGQWDSYVLKLDNLGNFMWARTLGSAGDDFALNIILDSNNNLYIAGDFTNTVDFNPGTGTYNLTSTGGYDAYAVKLKSNGNFVWARSVGGSTNDLASGIALDSSNNNVHITGWFSGTVDFDPGAGTSNITSIGGNDIFILKLQGTAPVAPAQTPGSLDLTFDKDGLVTTSINSYTDQAYSVAIQTDGKILVAGGFSNPGYDDFFVLRYNSNGTLDTSFGAGGVAQTDFGGDDVAQTIKVQSDGKIIVAGYTSPDGAVADFALARYNSNGSLDTTFGINGKITTSLGSGYDALMDMALQSDGKILAVGYTNIGVNDNDIVVARYNTNGSLDTNFSSDGKAAYNTSNNDNVGMSVVIQANEKIIIGGTTFNGSNTDFAIIRINTEGTLDTEFSIDGIATLDFGGWDSGGLLSLQPDGKIIIGGSDGDYNYHIARLNGNGNLDLSFDTDGKASTYLGVGYASVLDSALQSNGKIILAGYTRNSSSTDYDFTMVRYNLDGSLDTSFGVNGMVFTDFGSFDADLGNAVAIQSDGKIVMVGYRHIDGIDHDLAIARFIGDEQVATPLPTGWVGSVSVTSNKALVSVGRPHIGSEVASYDGFSSGSTTAFVPMLFKDAFGGDYDAALYIQNVSGSSASVTIQYYDSSGVLNCTKADSIAPLASKGYWLPAATCDTGSLPTGWVGGVKVTSTHPIVAVGRPHIGAEVMTYNGFSSGSTTAFIPMLFKGAFGGSYNAAFYVQNVSGSSANVTLEYFDNTGTLNCTKSDTIASLASKGYWLPAATCDTGSLPAGWVGGVRVSSSQPVVTVGRPHIDTQITTYDGFSAGANSAYVPMLFKGAFGGSYNAAFYLQNVSNSSASVTIKYYDNAGTLNCTKADTIAPLASKGYWVPAATCDTGSLPAGWVGGVEVTSDQPIVSVGRPHIDAQVTTYNGFTAGATDVFLPMLFKDAFGGSYDSAFYLQNTEATAATVTIQFYDATGALTCSRVDTIQPRATLGFWVPSAMCFP